MREKELIRAGWLSLVANTILSILKIVFGWLFKSEALLADGVHNASDILASIVSLTSIQISNLPADENHPYGHGKAETIASVVVVFFLFSSGVVMLGKIFASFFHSMERESMVVIFVSLFSLIFKEILYLYTIKLGRKFSSPTLIATAYDHLSDVFASLAVFVGALFTIVGQYFHLQAFRYGDPIAGLFVVALIFRVSYILGKDAVDVLMEKNASEEQLEGYRFIILQYQEVKRIDRLRARGHGHYVLIDARISIPGEYTIQQGHDLIRMIKKDIMGEYHDVQEVLIHLNPWYG